MSLGPGISGIIKSILRWSVKRNGDPKHANASRLVEFLLVREHTRLQRKREREGV